MTEDYHRVLLLFADGVGLAPPSETNPLTTHPTPAIEALLGGPLATPLAEARPGGGGSPVLVALDATLGVDGLPQSATGQTTLFTGVNAPAALGRHVTAFPGAKLQEILAEHSLLLKAVGAGRRATFANAFTPGYFRRAEERGRRRHSASTWAALAAGVDFRDLGDLEAGRAVSWDVERDYFLERIRHEARKRNGESLERARRIPTVEPAEAGHHLAAVAGEHHLTLYETFYTDLAGHHRWGIEPADAVRRLDGLLGGVLEALPADVTLVLTSDHGNLEDDRHTVHTRNPVPLLAVGPAAGRFADLERLDQVAGRILEVIGA